MKKTYEQPEAEIVVFDTEDIITMSGGDIVDGPEIPDTIL